MGKIRWDIVDDNDCDNATDDYGDYDQNEHDDCDDHNSNDDDGYEDDDNTVICSCKANHRKWE